MVEGLRGLIAAPFARPPGGRSWPRRFAPELAAGAVYLVMAAAGGVLSGSSQQPFADGAAWGYLLAAGILTAAPLASAAAALAGERGAGTLEALLLTPADRTRLVWGRYWNLVLPWARFIGWLLPIYALCFFGREEPSVSGGEAVESLSLIACIFAPKPLLAAALLGVGDDVVLSMDMRVLVLVLRALRDLGTLLMVVAAGLYCSARARSAARALGMGLLVLPLALGTLFSSAEWMTWLLSGQLGLDEAVPLYFFWSVITVVAELVIAFRLVSAVARNFDRYVMGERSVQ